MNIHPFKYEITSVYQFKYFNLCTSYDKCAKKTKATESNNELHLKLKVAIN